MRFRSWNDLARNWARGADRVALSTMPKAILRSCALWLAVPLAGAAELTIALHDGDSRPTAAAVKIYDGEGNLHVPASALELGGMGYLYREGALIHYADWTTSKARSQYPYFGSSWFRRWHPADAACFFAEDEFRIDLPPGVYRLVATKGPEFSPVSLELTMADDPQRATLRLSRWVDMAARGWYSGDGHVHIERPGPEANDGAFLWARAEDVRVANILLMGDARETYYPQHAFGRDGRAERDGIWLLPGQEDPRTRYLGHTLHLGTPQTLRNESTYYRYLPVFAGNDQGGVSGFAHVGRRNWFFHVDRSLTLLAPSGVVDFAEIAQMGYIGVNMWYEFLNLGFRIAAMGGSDVPWGGTLGTTRVYAYTGDAFDADRWLEAVRRGHTFVTTGPMLELTVNGQPPGTVLRVAKGDLIRVSARTWGHNPNAKPVRLAIVSFGDELKSATGGPDLALEFEVRAERSFWITAVGETNEGMLMDVPGFFSGAVATPVYVEVDGQPTIDFNRLPGLIERRLQNLEEIEQWLAEPASAIEPGGRGGWESADAFERSKPALREQVREARDFYLKLRTARSGPTP